MIALLDCNNFYVSCERLFNPKLIGKPVVVLSNNDGCIISRSNEAKNIGIKMGEPLFKIKNKLADNKVIVCSSNYSFYGDISNRIMNILKNNFDKVEIYSIDEAFFNLNKLNNREEECIYLANKILKWTGIPVSIGIAKTKTLAKITNRVIKKKDIYRKLDFHSSNVLEIRKKEDLEYVLKTTNVEDVWGVGGRLSIFLKNNSIKNAFDLKECNESFIRRKKGVVLERTVLELRGVKCNQIEDVSPDKKSICVSRSFGRKLRCYHDVRSALIVYVQKAASKMRMSNLFCRTITIFLKTSRYESNVYNNSKTYTLIESTIDLRLIWKVSDKLLKEIYKESFSYSKVGVILSDFCKEESMQRSLIEEKLNNNVSKKNGVEIMKLIDIINSRFGYDKIKLSSDCDKSFFSKEKNSNEKISWQMKSEYRSPCYTTSWHDILKVKV